MCAKKVAVPKKKPPKKAAKKKPVAKSQAPEAMGAEPPIFVGLAGNAPPEGEPAVERVFNCIRTVDRPDDVIAGMNTAPQGLDLPDGPLPPAVDLRAAWWNVGDQGATGSCVGWAVGDGLLRWYLIFKNRINQADRLSVRYVWMSAKETDEFDDRPTTFLEDAGTSIGSALSVVKRLGCVRDHELPMNGGLVQQSTESFYATAGVLKVEPYIKIQNDVDVWRRWLFRQGPMAARLLVDQSFMNAKAATAKLDVNVPFPRPHTMPHAVTIVGYLADGTFIIRNSWGVGWGDGGFAYATENYMLSAFNEFFGVYSSF